MSRDRLVIGALSLAVCAGLAAAQAIRIERKPKKAQPVPVAPGIAPEPITMENVNRRWSQTRCQIRVALDIGKDRDGQGWSASDWIDPPVLPRERKHRFRVLVSDRASLERGGHLSKRKTLRPGTLFVAEGWRFTDPRKNKGLVLDLRFEGLPIKARMEFDDTNLDSLETVDTLAKVQLFQVLEKVEAAPPARPVPIAEPEPPARNAAPASRAVPEVFDPAIAISAVSVMPATVTRGGKMDLIVIYTVKGVPPGAAIPVTETRQIRAGERQLASFEEQVHRAAGAFTSTQSINTPADLAPGVYAFDVTLAFAGKVEKSRAFFELK